MNRIASCVVWGLGSMVVVTGCHPAATEPQAVQAEPAAAVKKEPQLTGVWDNKLMRGMDPVNGTYHIGFSGRFVLSGMGGKGEPLVQGNVTVDVYEVKPADGGAESKLLEEWIIESSSLPAFGRQES